MVDEEGKKTLELFGYVFLVFVAMGILGRLLEFFKPEIEEYKPYILQSPLFILLQSPLPILVIILCIVLITFYISFYVLYYQSAGILKKHGKTKIAPIFWLLLLFMPAGLHLIPAVILWIKNNNLLREGTPS